MVYVLGAQYIQCKAHFNRSKARVDIDLLISNLLQGSHSLSDIVEVLDWPRQPLGEVFYLVHDLLHQSQVLGVHVAAIQHLPSISLGCHGYLQVL